MAGSNPERVGTAGVYANPVVTPDGKWVVLAKTDRSWGSDNYVVRFNVETGREFRVSLEAAEEVVKGEFAPLVQTENRFLQATGKADEFWAAIPDEPKDQTRVGRYNLQTFLVYSSANDPAHSFRQHGHVG